MYFHNSGIEFKCFRLRSKSVETYSKVLAAFKQCYNGRGINTALRIQLDTIDTKDVEYMKLIQASFTISHGNGLHGME
jgi:hypothetical protein